MGRKKSKRKKGRNAGNAAGTRTPLDNEQGVDQAGPLGWRRVAGVAGLLVLCVSLMFCELLTRTVFLWLARDDYAATEFEVTLLDNDPESDGVSGIVKSTGEEVRVAQVPTELHDQWWGGAVGTAMSPERARGKRVPIWYAPSHTSAFDSPAVVFQSEHPTLPDGAEVLSVTLMTLGIVTLGIVGLVFGFR